MDRRTRYSPEVRERSVRLMFEQEGDYSSQWSAIVSKAANEVFTGLRSLPMYIANWPEQERTGDDYSCR